MADDWASHLRLISHSAGRDSSALDPSADAALAEAIRSLNAMCKAESNEDLVTRVYPPISKLFQRCCSSATLKPSTTLVVLEILQFFLDHGEAVLHDADPSLRSFFRYCLVRQYADPDVAAATIEFLNRNKLKLLLSYPSVLPQYFPLILKIIAWDDEKLDQSFVQLFPAIMAPASFLQLFFALLDLPTMVLALESLEQRAGTLVGNSASAKKNPAPEALLQLMDEAYTGTAIGGDESVKEGSTSLHHEAESLFADLLRDENEGLGERHWRYPGMKEHLETAMGSVQSSRLRHALRLAPVLLKVYFDVALRDVNDSLLLALLPMIFFRIDAMFPDKQFSEEVRQKCFEFIHACFQKSPYFIPVLKKPITDSVSHPQTSAAKTELALQLCWAIGEHGGGGEGFKDAARELFETMELVLYENLSASRLTKSAAVPTQSRLLCFVITAIAKLSTCHQELSPRARVCLAKVARSQHVLDKIVWKRARDYLGLMHDPAICSSILAPSRSGQRRPGSVEWDKAGELAVANIPFYLLAERQGPPFHDFSFADVLGTTSADHTTSVQ